MLTIDITGVRNGEYITGDKQATGITLQLRKRGAKEGEVIVLPDPKLLAKLTDADYQSLSSIPFFVNNSILSTVEARKKYLMEIAERNFPTGKSQTYLNEIPNLECRIITLGGKFVREKLSEEAISQLFNTSQQENGWIPFSQLFNAFPVKAGGKVHSRHILLFRPEIWYITNPPGSSDTGKKSPSLVT